MDKVVYISLLILKMIKMQKNLLLISLIHFLITSFLIGRLQPHTRSLSKTVLRRLRVWLNHTFKIFHITLSTSFGGHFAAYLRGDILENAHWVHVSSDKVIATCMMHRILHADWTDVEKLQPKWREKCI